MPSIGTSVAMVGRAIKKTATAVGSVISSAKEPLANGALTVGSYALSPLIYAAKSTPGRIARNAFANVASEMSPNIMGTIVSIPGFRHDDDTFLLAHSPEFEARKLNEYCESYDLTNYSKHMKVASEAVKKSATSLLAQDNGSNVDIFTFGEFGKILEKKSEHLRDRESKVKNINNSISACISKNILNEMQNKFISLQQEIERESSNFTEPNQIIKTYEEIRNKGLDKLKHDKENSKKMLDELFNNNDFTKDLLSLSNNNVSDISTEEKTSILNKYKSHIIDHVNESYEKTEATLKESFEDTPAKKEKDNETSAVAGLNKKITHLEKERCEADLLKKIHRLEDLEKKGYQLPGQKLSVNVGKNQRPKVDPDFRKKFLKKIKHTDLDAVTIDGWLYGQRQSDNHRRTISGTKLVYEKDINDQVTSVSIEIPGSWFSYHNTGDYRMLADYEDMVKDVKSMQNEKDVQTIHFKHNTTIDELRNQMILESYRAARKNGILPQDIRMTVLGIDKEKGNNFIEKPALEIMQALGLNYNEAEADANQVKNKKDEIQLAATKVKSRYDDLKIDSISDFQTKDEDISSSVNPRTF